jgi:hypothetical protein
VRGLGAEREPHTRTTPSGRATPERSCAVHHRPATIIERRLDNRFCTDRSTRPRAASTVANAAYPASIESRRTRHGPGYRGAVSLPLLLEMGSLNKCADALRTCPGSESIRSVAPLASLTARPHQLRAAPAAPARCPSASLSCRDPTLRLQRRRFFRRR